MSETKADKIRRLARLLRIKDRVRAIRRDMVKGAGKDVGIGKVNGGAVKVNRRGDVRNADAIRLVTQKIAELKKRIMHNTKARIKKAQDEVDSVLENAEDTIDESLKDKNYAITQPKIEVADVGDLARSKEDALDQLPDTMLAEDIRSSYKKALGLVWKKMNKNLEGEHILKAALFEVMNEVNISRKVAVGVIETAFDRAAIPFLASVFKRADEVVKYEPEVIAQMAAEEDQTVLVIPEGTQVSIEVEEGSDEGEVLVNGEPIEEGDEDVLERVTEGSFRVPKSRDKRAASMLSRAVPRYYK